MVENKKEAYMNPNIPQINNTKTSRIIVRLTDEEKLIIQKNANHVGLTISKYVRKLVLTRNPIFLPAEEKEEFQKLILNSNEIKRTLNLYHEKRKETIPFLNQLKSFIKKIKD